MSPRPWAGGEECEAAESAPGQKWGEQGSACQSVLPKAADKQNQECPGGREGQPRWAAEPTSLSGVRQRGSEGQRGRLGQAGAKGLQTRRWVGGDIHTRGDPEHPQPHGPWARPCGGVGGSTHPTHCLHQVPSLRAHLN